MNLESERLDYRPWKISDLEILFSLHTNPKVMKHIRPIDADEEQTLDRLKEMIQYAKDYPGQGIWMAKDIESDEYIGWCCLIHIDTDPENPIEVGYRLFPRFWGKGYATEMAQTLIDHARDYLKLKSVCAITTKANIASWKVMEKCGFEYIENRNYYDTDVMYYEMKLT